jgi:hypothetical protein
LVMSCKVNSIVTGTPSAVPAYDPKLDRMSLRTTPDSTRTFGPFDPSPGYGPAVSDAAAVVQAGASNARSIDVAAAVVPPAGTRHKHTPSTVLRRPQHRPTGTSGVA